MANSGGSFDPDSLVGQLQILNQKLEDPEIWKDHIKISKLNKEKTEKETKLSEFKGIEEKFNDIEETLKISFEINEEGEIPKQLKALALLESQIDDLETKRYFSKKNDLANAFVDIQSGSGGTEAQDWVAMIMRMYLKWIEKHSFTSEITEASEGEVAGFKNVTIKVNGDYAYGWLRTETGVHRLVRKSPFDSGNRRHTSFASVFIYPQVDDSFEIEINPSDLRIDVFRASGAGGQHVNTTESAVRITHLPTKIVVQCQNDRSQHKNKESAMKQLRAKLYAHELNKKNEIKTQVESEKSDISWGNQIRSYVLDDSRIKDLRTNFETGNTQSVLDGNLDDFIQESLKRGL